MSKILTIAHRGAMGLEPENTIRAIKKAIDLDVDAVEVDVYLSRDNQIAVTHSEQLNICTNGQGLVWDKTIAELKQLDAGEGEKIPLLQEVIDTVKDRCILLIDVKVPEMEKDLIDIINKNDLKDNAVLISFFHESMKKVKHLDPEIKTGVTFMCAPANVSNLALNVNAEYIIPQYEYLTKEMIDNAHENKLKVLAWDTDDLNEMKKLIKLGVDGIFSNRPDLFKEL